MGFKYKTLFFFSFFGQVLQDEQGRLRDQKKLYWPIFTKIFFTFSLTFYAKIGMISRPVCRFGKLNSWALKSLIAEIRGGYEIVT